MTAVTNKSELLFLYDVKDANPNGDPLDENKPRIDEETGQNIVTDVRLKRTIRDFFITYKGYNGKNENRDDVFVREVVSEGGGIQDGKKRGMDFDGHKENVLDRCIDVRLFGCTIPKDKDSITLTGPVQFKMGRSLHPVVMKHIQGTGAFASQEGRKHTTFREEDILYYSLIAFHGIINPAAAAQSTATENDINLLIEGMWEGTRNLISRSKFGQMPRLLLKVNYTSPRFFIGDLDRLISMKTEMPFEKVRSITDFQIEVGLLKDTLSKVSDKIASIQYMVDPGVALCIDGKSSQIKELCDGFDCQPITFE